jgi:hypothetical protein
MDQQDTSLTFLREAQTGNDRAWRRLAKLYEPLIAGWAKKHAALPEDTEERNAARAAFFRKPEGRAFKTVMLCHSSLVWH